MRAPKKRVIWKKGEESIKKGPLPFFPAVDLPSETIISVDLARMAKVQPGALFAVVNSLGLLPTYPGRSLPPHPYLVNEAHHWRRYPIEAVAGDLLVYMGEVRVPEGPTTETVRRMVRHKFLLNGGVFIVYHLNAIVPVVPT